MTNNEAFKAKQYEDAREHARNLARTEFLQFHEKSNNLIVYMNELVTRHLYFIQGKDWSEVENADYFCKLIVSFTRTHFLLYDLIICNELIEASVLFRKQLELVSRLHELEDSIDLAKILGRTPNIKHLEYGLKRLYSEHTEVAHSSTIEKMNLLGLTEHNGTSYTAAFPTFDENSYASFSHLFFLITQYHYWIAEKYGEWFEDYDKENDCNIYTKCYELYNEVFIENPKFKKIQPKKA